MLESAVPVFYLIPTSTEPEYNRVLCQCVTGVKHFGAQVPDVAHAGELPAIASIEVGGLALFTYEANEQWPEGIPHVSYITDITATGFWVKETNYERCTETRRHIDFNDPNLRGFYSYQQP